MDAVRFVGPIAPATKNTLSLCFSDTFLMAFFAILTASIFSSSTIDSNS